MKILFLEDDPIIADTIIDFLHSKKYNVDYVFDLLEAKDMIEKNSYDLLLLDVNVPSGNSFDLLNDLRNSSINTPAIFITALNSINDVKKGFESGCDDYIKKPFELDELNLRINNLKRIYNLDNTIHLGGNLFLDKLSNSIKIDNEQKHISKKEILILEYLLKNKNRAISINELCSNLWEYDAMPTDATIRTYIKNLRNILGSERIENVKGVGYRFIKS